MSSIEAERVLIVGVNSYIGDSFAKYAAEHLHVDIVDSYEEWKAASFEGYDSILLVAGLAHQNWNRKQRNANKDLYFSVNRDLAIAVAKKAKASGVEQFIYLSSMAVYGLSNGAITADIKPSPREKDYYGLSKYQAEKALAELLGNNLCIIRPPMVYGPNCPGNFSKLVQLAKKMPVFPKVNNRRSMIHIDNLCAFILLAINNKYNIVHLPQNKEYVNTTNLVQIIANLHGRKLRITKLFNPLVFIAGKLFSKANKLFGSLIYARDEREELYNVIGFEESVRRTIGV